MSSDEIKEIQEITFLSYRIANLMREHCMEAKKYGDEKVKGPDKLKKVLVILNPAANKRNAEDNFNDFCAPIISLAGYMIEVAKTQSENHAIKFVEELSEYPDLIVVAGGDGTVSEVITALMRNAEISGEKPPAIGVLPLGLFNQSSLMLINGMTSIQNKVENVRSMADAALAIVKGNTAKKDVMKVELIPNDGEEEEVRKPFYALGSLHWGAFNDILRKRESYWLTGSLRDYVAMFFNGGFSRAGVNWDCKAKIIYSLPCDGCSNCYEKVETKNRKLQNSRWWSKFNAKEKDPEYSKILNPQCLETAELDIETSELAVATNLMENKNQDTSMLNIKLSPSHNDHGLIYIWNSWKRVNNRTFLDIPASRNFSARQFTLFPVTSDDNSEKESTFTIDNNVFEVRPIKVTILPKKVEIFVTA